MGGSELNPVTSSEDPPSSEQAPSAWRRLMQQVRNPALAEPATLVLLAMLVGVIGGLGAVVFRWLISVVRTLVVGIVFGPKIGWAAAYIPYVRVLSPALGLVLVGVITTYFAREVKGHGVPQILESIALRGGKIRPRVAFFGILAPAITIGAEGSVGREGPIALIGAAFGSIVGQVLRLADQQITLLVACGAAAGIGATFNAPVAGALFGMEVVLGSYAMAALVPCFVASVVGVTVFQWIEGSQPILPTPAYTFAHPLGVVLVIPLGILAGLMALAYTRGLTFVETLNEHLPGNFVVKAVLGGLAVGILGFFVPQILGVGYASMESVAAGITTGAFLLVLLLGKYVATLLTIGSGGSGGVFAPSLFLGVSLGGAYGTVVHNWLPGISAPAALYGVAGMGAVFAAAAQAPLTAATIILEMTGDYTLVTGVMLACAISYIFYASFARDSMYTVRLRRRGIQILRGTEVQPLNHVPISAAIDPKPVTLASADTVEQAARILTEAGARAAVVLDASGQLAGVLDGARVFETVGGAEPQPDVGQLARRDVPVLTPNASLDDAMRRFGVHGVTILPVVTDTRSRQLIGVVSHESVLAAYYRQTVATIETRRNTDVSGPPVGRRSGGRFREVELGSGWPAEGGVPVSALGFHLPRGVVLVAVTRGDTELAVRGDTGLCAGDRVLLYATGRSQLADAERILQQAKFGDEQASRGQFREVILPAGAPAAVRDLDLPVGALLVSVRRGPRTIVPSGSTALQPGDVVTLFGAEREAVDAAERALKERRLRAGARH